MTGNCHVRFLGGKGAVRPLPYPVSLTIELSEDCIGLLRVSLLGSGRARPVFIPLESFGGLAESLRLISQCSKVNQG